MNDLRWINYDARRMLLDTISMSEKCELAHRRLCDYIWAVGELPPDNNDLLRQHTRCEQPDWARIRRELGGKGWFTRGVWLAHRGVIDTYNSAQANYVASFNQTSKARGVPPIVCVTHPETGLVSYNETHPVTPPVTQPGTAAQSEQEPKEKEIPVQLSQTSWAGTPVRDLTKLTVKNPACDRIAGEILNNSRQWHWDNCKVQPGDFVRASLSNILVLFSGKLTEKAAHEAWREAVVRTHKACVDGLVKKTPAGYAVKCWRDLMEQQANGHNA